MARFPIIERPCPLGQKERAGISGHCGVCGKTVHSLDGMDDAGRSALLSQAKGAICVIYRLPLKIALALSLAGPAFAQDSPPPPPCEVAGGPAAEQPEKEEIVVTGGTVRDPADAQWTEDLTLPELPTAPDDTTPGK